MNVDVVIIGAGIAGLTAAAELLKKGVSCLLLEKGLFPGGHTARLSCKATKNCARCNACLLEESVAALALSPHYRLLVQTTVSEVEQENDGYRLSLSSAPVYLNTDKCVDCGLCHQACPEPGKALRLSPTPAVGPGFNISAADCLHLQGRDCQACADACPVGAIDFAATGVEREVKAKALIVAAGFTPFEAEKKPRYGYGRLPDVVTALDADRQLRSTAALTRPSNGVRPQRVAFVQCVGSRDPSIGREYCSRVCCGYALRMAHAVKYRWPDTGIAFFYMDIQNFGRNFSRNIEEIGAEIELLHGVPGEITGADDGSLAVPFLDEATGRKSSRSFDLVVLSIGLGPPDSGLASALNLETDEDGFLLSKQSGVFIAGAAAGPMDAAEARAHGRAAAAETAFYLKGAA